DITRTCNISEEYFATSFNITPAEFRLLKIFFFTETISIKELCAKLNLTPGRITQIITKLETKKFVTRTIDKADKRNIFVSLTPKSKPFVSNLYQSHININLNLLKQLDLDKREVIAHLLEILIEDLKKRISR
ncbi:MAG TPA: MarR family transcriptional regulator, partial [Ignavibacteriaceae bacterium]|nr:MarR family transcriptional regulator [Ignavibacteriaceae bacterium]